MAHVEIAAENNVTLFRMDTSVVLGSGNGSRYKISLIFTYYKNQNERETVIWYDFLGYIIKVSFNLACMAIQTNIKW